MLNKVRKKSTHNEVSGSVVECLTQDQRGVGSSLTRGTMLCP